MSVYDQFDDERQEGKFLKFKDGVTRKLKLVSIAKKLADKPEYGDANGYCREFEFTDLEDGSQKFYYRKEMKGFGFQLEKAGIEPGDCVAITRTGEGMDTRYAMTKITEDGMPAGESGTALGAGMTATEAVNKAKAEQDEVVPF